MKCSVPFCSSKSSEASLAQGGLGVTFHEFPKEAHLRAAWLRALGKQDCQLPDSAVVCSQHFLHDDICETEDCARQLCTDAVPSTVLVCMTCLDIDSKMFPMSQDLRGAYEQLTGYPPCDGGNLKLTLCVQCAQRLRDFTSFREQSLRARSLMMELLEKHELITLQHLKMMRHANNLLKNNLVSTTLGPDPCDMYKVDNTDEGRQIDSEETVLGVAVKTECSDDSQSVDKSAHSINEENSYADCVSEEFYGDPSNYERAAFTCTVCFEEFPHEHAYSAHVCMHLHDQAPKSNKTNTVLKSCVVQLYDILKYPQNAKIRVESSPQTLQAVSSHDNAHTACKDAHVAATHNEPAASVLSETEPATSGSSSRIGSFSCDYCQRAYSQKHNLIAHRRTHTGEKPYSCQLCGYKCIQKGYLDRHMRAHTGEKPYSCKLCSYKFIQKSCLNRHMRVHTGEKPYSCELCSFKCTRKGSLNRHMRGHTGEKPYSCQLCSYKCIQKGYLDRHMRAHTGEKPYSCKLCSYKFIQKSCLNRHMRVHTGEKPYSCELCSFKCTRKGSLNRHMRGHTGEKPYSCKFCSHKCTVKSNLVSHMRTHTGENPYLCTLCSYKCAQKSSLVYHMKIHTGGKPYSCKLCSYKCTVRWGLDRHMRAHTGEKPYYCKLCVFKCTEKGNLVSHMRTHTGEKPYSCELCSYKCTEKRYLVSHNMRAHTGEKLFSCELCSYKCKQKVTFVGHMRTHTDK